MREKTKSFVLSVDLDDPSTSEGITNVARKVLPYVADKTPCGEVRKKTAFMGKSTDPCHMSPVQSSTFH